MKLCSKHLRCNKERSQKSDSENCILEEGTNYKQNYDTILVTEYKQPKIICALIKPVLEDCTCHRKRNVSVRDQM